MVLELFGMPKKERDQVQVHLVSRTGTKQYLRRIAAQRPVKGQQVNPPHNTVQPCVALTAADLYDLPKVLELLHLEGHLQASMLLPHEAAYVPYPLSSGHKADVFILSNGSIVSFGMTEIETVTLADSIKSAEIRSYPIRESEDMDYVEFPYEEDESLNPVDGPKMTRSFMDGEVFCICGAERILDKVAFASGLARSTKLAVIEMDLERFNETIRDITDRLATGRKLPVRDGREVLKKTGELLSLRGNLNLYSELTETPDLYWTEPELENIYKQVSKTLDIGPRIAILNKKLDYVSEVVSILKAHLSEETAHRLEWMVIILITIEIGFETAHYVERYFDRTEAQNQAHDIGKLTTSE
ncbi:uncharacterized protein V1516DRAFT_695947 [Lipomyces oligophaga]|uniref:uncharacterized protein n=1 Tax=Lipomyces oligophaga TaxID=45792 RepID=UPI0034CE2548